MLSQNNGLGSYMSFSIYSKKNLKDLFMYIRGELKVVEPLVSPCLWKWRITDLNMDVLHSTKSCMREEKGTPKLCAHLPCLIWVKGVGVQHLHEWSTKIRSITLQEHYLLLQF
jgi:hypothetical protein